MAVIKKALKLLLPRGLVGIFRDDSLKLLNGAGDNIVRQKNYINAVKTEAIPLTATETLDDWFVTLGLEKNDTLTVYEKRSRASVAYTALGGSSLSYIIGQIQLQFPNVTIDEGPTDYEYTVTGDVTTIESYYNLRGLIQRITSLHCTPTYDIRIIDDLDTAYTGISVVGKAIVGRIAT